MRILIEGGLPFVAVDVGYRGREISLKKVLVDTGSAGTVLRLDKVSRIGVVPEPDDPLRRIVGVGGAEFVFVKHVDILRIGKLSISDFVLEVGNMDYGIEMDGLLGTDFLSRTGASVNFATKQIQPGASSRSHQFERGSPCRAARPSRFRSPYSQLPPQSR